MSPENEPREPVPIDPPDNTVTSDAAGTETTTSETTPRKIDPPDNT